MTRKFNRRIMQVEAFQWDGYDERSLPAWFKALKSRRAVMTGGDAWLIERPSSLSRPVTVVLPGDWVTCDHVGEIDVVPASIFALQYEAAA